MVVIGEVSLINKEGECSVEWKMDFQPISKEVFKQYYNSPDFSFEDEVWSLIMHSNGRFFDLGVNRLSSSKPPMKVKFTLALKTVNGQRVLVRHRTEYFAKKSFHIIQQFFSSDEFEKRQSEFLCFGSLVVVSTLKILSEGSERECCHCHDTFEQEEVESHERKCRVKCPDCLDIVLLKYWEGHECQTLKIEDESLSQVFEQVLLHGTKHDVILKVGEKELKAHADILSARSSIFKNMLNSDMKEKRTGIIEIPDCNSQAMEQFLSYVYSGKLDFLDQTNMFDLYYISEKYDVESLKRAICSYIKKSLTPDNFCNIFQLAMDHNDSCLIEFTREYFMNNVPDILRSNDWPAFISDHFSAANELLIESHEKKKESIFKNGKLCM